MMALNLCGSIYLCSSSAWASRLDAGADDGIGGHLVRPMVLAEEACVEQESFIVTPSGNFLPMVQMPHCGVHLVTGWSNFFFRLRLASRATPVTRIHRCLHWEVYNPKV